MQFDVVRPQHPGVIASWLSVGWLRHTKRRRTQNGEEYRTGTIKYGPNASTLILRYTDLSIPASGGLERLRRVPHLSPLRHGIQQQFLYWAVVTLSATRWMEAACTVVTVDLFTMDFSINPAREGRQTQKSFPDPRAVPGCAGREPIATMTVRTAAKIAKRRIGRSSGERYGGWVMAVPQNFQK